MLESMVPVEWISSLTEMFGLDVIMLLLLSNHTTSNRVEESRVSALLMSHCKQIPPLFEGETLQGKEEVITRCP